MSDVFHRRPDGPESERRYPAPPPASESQKRDRELKISVLATLAARIYVGRPDKLLAESVDDAATILNLSRRKVDNGE